MATYETFAAVYDAVMDDSLYDLWTDFSLRHLPKTKDKKKLTLITIKRLWFGEKFYLTGGFKIHLCQKVNFLYFS